MSTGQAAQLLGVTEPQLNLLIRKRRLTRAQYRAHMASLGKKGGKASGAKRMEMPVEERRRIASLAARAMWAKRKGVKKR